MFVVYRPPSYIYMNFFPSFMRFFTLSAFFALSISTVWSQDRVIRNNGDTLIGKVNRYDNTIVDYQLSGETVTESISTQLISSIILGSGRVIKPEVLEAKKIAPVFGFYKGKCLLSNEEKTFGLPRLRSSYFEGVIIEDLMGKINASAAMTGACLATYKIKERAVGQTQSVTAEYYAFSLPSPTFYQDNIIGKKLTLVMMDSYTLGQSELISMINFKTVEHLLEFTADGKIIEDGKPAGSYSMKGEEISLSYLYTNKKGKVKEVKGSYKVGAFDMEYIQLYFSNFNWTYFENVILKRSK